MRLRHIVVAVYAGLALLCAGIVGAAAAPKPSPAVASRFTGKFELVPLFDKGHRPVIRNGHQFYAERNTISFRTDAGDVVTAFAGSTTDGASIPQVAWPIMPSDGPWLEIAAFHDAGYKSKGAYDFHGQIGRTRARPYSRAEVDEILREGMVVLGVPAWKRVVIYEAVRLGGAGGWGH